METKLSEHLSLSEVTNSETAKKLGINNNPTPEHLANLKILAEKIFEPIRTHFGVPIHISSGYRSAALNAAVPGSAKNSQHAFGQALDLDQDNKGNGITNKQVFDWILKNLDFDQLIWEYGTSENPQWVHVSFNPAKKSRKEVLRCTKINGKPQYTKYS